MSVSPSRRVTFDVLHRVFTQDAYAVDLLHSALLDNLSNADRALAMEITMGVLRWRSVLERTLQPFIKQAFSRLDVEVQIALQMGAYQLLFLDRIPANAAVNESVELVKRSRKRSASGLANAVLRKIAGLDESAKRAVADSAVAHPAWMVERWKKHYGEEAATKLCTFNQQRPVTAIRFANPDAEAELRAAGIELEPGRIVRSARRVVSGDVTSALAFREGRVVIQDEASQLIALMVQGGSKILDCCAAPGGKTALMALRNAAAKITAVELHEHRLRLMRERVRATNVTFLQSDARQLSFRAEFDRILADMPCSGTGTLARNPEIKWRLKLEDLTELAQRQREILISALAALAPGGTLIYSTCSLEAEENEQVIHDVLQSSPGIELQECVSVLQKLEAEDEIVEGISKQIVSGKFLRTIPGVHDCDGFFAAVIRKIS